jgi:prepilin-type N-terminal cleavage/methylation domain-containing protein
MIQHVFSNYTDIFRRRKKRSITHRQFIRTKKLAGFSLIEILVTTTIFSMLMITITSIFMAYMANSARTSARHTVRGEGNFALSKIEGLIRNGANITSDCNATARSTLTLNHVNDGVTTVYTIRLHSNVIQVLEGHPTSPTRTENLTSSGTITASGLQFTCATTTFGGRQVLTKYTLTKNVGGIKAGEAAITETFQVATQMRN